MFHPVVAAWFKQRFAAPTPIQERAWPAIARGRDALIAAPTGSGKTLAAFLFCLDQLVRQAYEGRLEDRTEILYVSPLKALSNDVQKNLEEPCAELRAMAAAAGLSPLDLRIGLRTGDTSQSDRQKAVKRPPHVMVTTPESLFILLTSESGRRALCDVRTVIVDEIHAVAGDKRGAHLALSIERLDDLAWRARGKRPQRIGLSATVRPIEVAARLLVGARELPEIVDVGQRRDLDLAIETLTDELGAVCTNEQWEEVYDRIAGLAREHRSTLVFVNTRRLVERVAHALGRRIGEDLVAAHHGSLSRARRHDAERRLKMGALRVVVATASLELGIDVGSVDLSCLVGSPRSISTALQRVGRSGHAVAATPKGRLFPLTRDQLIECASIVRAAGRGLLDRITLRDAPLDVLAQQIVAICACEPRSEDEVFDLCKRAAPYAGLTRRNHDAVVDMLSEGIACRRGRAGALLHRDGVNQILKGRRAARLTALTSGGAIPDNASYDVVLEPEGIRIGALDEDFAIESLAGDVFLLGNSSWRVRRVEPGKVRVEDARGAAPTLPFWLGEAPARSAELSLEVGALRVALAAGGNLSPDGLADIRRECALDLRGAELARDYIAAGRAALGAVPSQTTVIAERFFDEAGGMQVVIHAPFGGRINRAWGMALRKRFCRTFDFELQAAATDDGVLLSLGPQHSFPLEAIFEMLEPEGVEELLVQAALQAPMFGTRWRWNASRALALVRHRGGRRVPAPIQRMRAADLLSAVFPAQQGCQDNHGVGARIEPPDHPLVSETIRDCLTEVMDVAGLCAVLRGLASGAILTLARDTPEPSVFAHEILNANPYAFLDDAPLEERRARAVTVRRGLPAEVVERLGALDEGAIEAVVQEAAPHVRDPDELHDLLLDLGVLPEREGLLAGWGEHFDALVRARRASRLASRCEDTDAARREIHGARVSWIAAERRALGAAIWPSRRFEPEVSAPAPRGDPPAPIDRDDAICAVVRARLALTGPITAAELEQILDLTDADVEIALARIEGEGTALRGRFRPAASRGPQANSAVEWCDRRLLARIHRRTVDRLRSAIEPATAADLIRFLLVWQGVRPASRKHGRLGLAKVIEQLQGFELAAGAWEREVLPARVTSYDSAWLDALCLSGEIAWGRLAPRDSAAGAPTRAAPITLARRRDLGWLLAPHDRTEEGGLSPVARDVLAHLRDVGASFMDEIALGAQLPADEVEEALWELVAAGRVTGDGFSGLRALLVPSAASFSGRGRFYGRARAAAPRIAAGRWALLRAPPSSAMTERAVSGESSRSSVSAAEEPLTSLARQYLRRYGIVFRDLLAREPHAPAWRDLLGIYRRMEMRGEIRGGRMVAGFIGEQFAASDALDALRAIRREPRSGEVIRLSACDPLNLVGVITPGPRIPAVLGHYVTYRDGVPLAQEERLISSCSAAASS